MQNTFKCLRCNPVQHPSVAFEITCLNTAELLSYSSATFGRTLTFKNFLFFIFFFLLHKCTVPHLHQTPTADGGPEWPAVGIGGAFISIVCIKVSVSKSPPKLHGRLHSERASVSSVGKKKKGSEQRWVHTHAGCIPYGHVSCSLSGVRRRTESH